MDGNLIEYLMTPVAQVGLIIGLAEIVKGFGVEKRWIPLVDLALGLTSGLFVYHLAFGYHVVQSAVIGIALGLSACGLFSGYKNVIGK
jgi:uncharacterized membrane protein HdeD (DUF308 family)